MPAYTNGERYMTIGFNDSAKLDDGALCPISCALTELTPDAETQIAAIMKQAVS